MEFKQGDPVIVYAPSFYRQPRVGIFMGPCKDHDESFIVKLLDENAPIKDVCANLRNRDTIERLPQSVPS